MVLGKIRMSEGLSSSWSSVRLHVQQPQKKIDSVWISSDKELLKRFKIFLRIMREGRQIVPGLGRTINSEDMYYLPYCIAREKITRKRVEQLVFTNTKFLRN